MAEWSRVCYGDAVIESVIGKVFWKYAEIKRRRIDFVLKSVVCKK